MKKIILLVLVICLALGLGYYLNLDVVYYDYVYRGESESWTAQLVGEGEWTFRDKGDFTTAKTQGFYKMTISYKGQLADLQALDQLNIFYDAGDMGGSELQIEGGSIDEIQFVFERFSGLKPGEKMDVVVTIQMDEKVEQFILDEINQ